MPRKTTRPQGAAPPRKRLAPTSRATGRAIALHEASKPLTETQALIEAITKASRDPKVIIEKMQWLLDARSKLLAEEAEQDFNDAMGRVQAALEPVRRNAANPQTHSRYATYPALDAAVRPEYSREGFSLSYDTADHPDPGKLNVLCYVTRGRHKRIYTIPMPIDGKGPKGGDVMSKTHATGSGFTYGKRYLLSGIFNIVIHGDDDDGNKASGYGYSKPVGLAKHPLEPDLDAVPERVPASKTAVAALRAVMKRASVPEDLVTDTFGVNDLSELTEHEVQQGIKKCNLKLNKMVEEEASRRDQMHGADIEQDE